MIPLGYRFSMYDIEQQNSIQFFKLQMDYKIHTGLHKQNVDIRGYTKTREVRSVCSFQI